MTIDDLLWGRVRRPTRGPKQGLDLERVITMAVEIADADGLAALTMSRLAKALGAGAASLYTYVPGKPALEALMLDWIIGTGPLPHTLPGTWRERLEAGARADWYGYRAHPWVLQLAVAQVRPGPNLVAWYDSTLASLEATGLTEPEKVDVVETLDAYVRGMARSALDPAPVPEDEPDGVAEAFPALIRAARAGALTPRPEESFEFGLARLLDGVEALVRERLSP
ncbi:TetR/AcrR family transcriptional regulator C-terminal domain-containing protein [Nonomuraea endophytica]|uniref:AcrR family transcriptional regulator n=1 Tax=Nonomuraea endophytica TaxID=714136 RepID=A0A7W8A3D2_9ACTN|nr:TetR/AcrR family transcriptional regulator C-terminal domain-containing protein [Nonomuraea endophytica]MBB5077991.1 AcrR family transcriptional regulator [Nonomuraea endophytica]